jgi:hypothetical protein
LDQTVVNYNTAQRKVSSLPSCTQFAWVGFEMLSPSGKMKCKHCQYIHACMHDEVPSKKKLEMSPWIPETPVLLYHFVAHLVAPQTETVP